MIWYLSCKHNGFKVMVPVSYMYADVLRKEAFIYMYNSDQLERKGHYSTQHPPPKKRRKKKKKRNQKKKNRKNKEEPPPPPKTRTPNCNTDSLYRCSLIDFFFF